MCIHTQIYTFIHIYKYIILIEHPFTLYLGISEISKTFINILGLNKVLIFLSSIFVIKQNRIQWMEALFTYPQSVLNFKIIYTFVKVKQQKN